MSRLFWKIFFAFWVSLILFAVVSLFAANQAIEHFRDDKSISGFDHRIRNYARDASVIASEKGIEGLTQFLKTIDRREAVPVMIVNEAGEELLGRSVHPHLQNRINRILNNPDSKRRRMGPMPVSIIDVDGHGKFLMFPDIKALSLARVLGRPRVLVIPLLLAALASALVGMFLARYITAPIARMRRATHKLAEGDFSHRVTPEIGSRRDEIADLAQDFDNMADRLQILIAAQRQLLSDVSHELRSPLARLQVALGLARLKSDGKAEKELNRIEQESECVNELIGQLLSLSRLESRRYDTSTSDLDLNHLLKDVVEDANYEARERQCEVILHEQTEISLDANEALLKSAVENVVRNAVNYTADSSQVTVSLQQLSDAGKRCLIEVRDQGPGVPEDKLDSLFEPFVRVGEARDRNSGGFGLGLSIAERAIRVHGGHVKARNHPDGGLLVSIELPF